MLASFRREKAKGKKTIGTGKGRQEIYLLTWFAFTRMAFLLDKDEPTQTMSSYTEDDRESDKFNTINETCETNMVDDQSTIINNDNLEDIFETIPQTQTTLPNLKRTSCTTIQKRAKQKIPREDKIDEAFNLLKNVVVKQKPEVSDACSDYGKHVGNKLRNYSERAKALVQYHINNILFQADMGHFDVNKNIASMNYYPYYQNSSPTLPTSNPTTPIPTPSPQETMQSGMSYSDLSSPLGDCVLNRLEQSTSTGIVANFLDWQKQCNN